jgi:hypothetical protein
MEFRILDVENIDTTDYPDFCDAYCVEAEVKENGEWREATEEELDIINNEYGESIHNVIFEEQLYL